MKMLKKYIYQIVLVAIVGLIFITNIKGNTSLIGWDNFNSELGPTMAVKQALNAGWSNFRSLGLVAGMGYATDIIHAVFVWITSFVLPLNLVRYFFHSFVLLSGGLGVFSLFCFMGITPFFSFLGALYYILNFGTVQIFGLPYEPFSMFFGFAPWAILSWFQTLHHINKKSLITFFLANVLLSGAFYVQTMFIIYGLLVGIINILYLFGNRNHFLKTVKKIVFLWIIVGAVNMYWLLTQLYFLKTSVSVVQEAKQVLLGWRIPFFENKVHSTFFDFFTQKGYYADFQGINDDYLFAPWLQHFSLGPVILLVISIVGIILVGLLDGKNKYKKYFVLFLFLHAVALLMNIPIFREINTFFRQFNIVDQILRSPFSKFTMSLSMILGYFFTIGTASLYTHIQHSKWKYTLAIFFVSSIMLVSFPIFTGNFFAGDMKVAIPQEYFKLFDFFKKQDKDKRIVTLPELNMWGWYTYRWGYQGSGFLWHGIEQPIVSRSYDVWSRASENYLWEISNALQKEDVNEILNVWNKYNISYVIVDKSQTGLSPKAIYFQLDRFENLTKNNNNIKKVFQTKNIQVYEMIQPSMLFTNVSNLPNVGPKIHSLYEDTAFNNLGPYKTDENKTYDAFYPFLDLQSSTIDKNKRWDINEGDNYFEVRTSLPAGLDNQNIKIASHEAFIYDLNREYKTVDMPIFYQIHNNILSVRLPKIKLNPINFTQVQSCDQTAQPVHSTISTSTQNGIKTVTAKNGERACFGYHFDSTLQKYGYLLKVDTENVQGVPLSFYVVDLTKQNNYMQYQLNENGGSYFVLPSTSPDGVGLSINFQNPSYQNTDSINRLKEIGLYLFPEKALKESYFGKTMTQATVLSPIKINDTIGNWSFTINQNNESHDLVFNQAFNDGWKAYEINDTNWLNQTFPFLFGQEIKNHVLINNWANGWLIRPNETTAPEGQHIIIIFWPQYLEFVGFGLMLLALLFVLKFKH